MLLALWSDFWNTADWVTGPTPPPVTTTRQQLGGPGKKKRERYPYQRADSEYWEEYEKMLRRHAADLEKPVPEEAPEQLVILHKHRATLVEAAKRLPTVEQLRAVDAKISSISSQIQEFDLQSRDEEDAILALLL